MTSIRIPFNKRLLVVKFLGIQKLYLGFQLGEEADIYTPSSCVVFNLLIKIKSEVMVTDHNKSYLLT